MDADVSAWTLLAAFNRWALYALMLIATGSGLFALLTPAPTLVKDAAARLGKITALIAAIAFITAVGLGGAEMITGDADILVAPDTWTLAAGTTLGLSAGLGVPAMLVLWCGFAAHKNLLVVLGVIGGIGSFLLTGHAATAHPAWLVVPVIALHLTGAAYWIGALYPLHRALGTLDSHGATVVIAAFSRHAVRFVAAIVVSGAIIGWIQLGAASTLWETTYGLRLTAKIVLFGLVFALAGLNKLVLSPNLTAGRPNAPHHLRRIIVLEYSLILLILGAAVSLTLTEPPRKQLSNSQSAVSQGI